ncbi:TAXI family TRAP transporter solute-binding subunit [Pseudoruegeria sp. HB172150]|uniref:TAXI family TRAP transporter solute-binding subunit n=1 Tax=Pseudoruegeria sp. HB172150 TaxID=2721164 RepID=UPI00155510CC|nr:TAXI family TRAP transporter solute-binding subunit [Pseudoruegeria sp. HB172150]
MRNIPGKCIAAAVFTAGLALGTGAQAQDSYEWPEYFTVVTPIVGTANHSLGVAWTSEFSAQTESRARVLPAPNGYSRALWLVTGEGDISMLQASDYFDHMDGIEGYSVEEGGPADTRVAVMNMVTPWSYLVRGDSDIQSFSDIGPDTRVALATSSSFLMSGIDALLAYNGMTRDDVQIVEVGNYGANTKIISEGRADVAFTSPLSGTSYEAEANPNGIRWLPLPAMEYDPEAYQRYRDIMTGYVPGETVSGVESALGLNMDHAFQANHVRADEDEEFVYHLAKWLDEHYEDFKEDFTHAPMMSVDSMVAFLKAGHLQPLHEGTIRYLEEKSLWTDTYQTRQDALVKLAQDRAALWAEAVETGKAEGLQVSPESEDWATFWSDYKAEHGIDKSFGELVMALP